MKGRSEQPWGSVRKHSEKLNTKFFKNLSFIILAVLISSILVKPALALDPLVVWTESGIDDDVMRFSAYSSGWGSEGTAADMGDTASLQWHVAETSPDGTEQVGLAVGSSTKIVYATLYDGTNWSTKKNLSPLYSSVQRGFSAAYEQSSGDLLIVQGTANNNEIKYWVWNGSTWVVDGLTYTFNTAIPIIDDNVVWVELASDPTTNQIALMVVDIDYDVAALIWDGDTNSWDSLSEKKLNSAFIPTYNEKQIDVEYMQSGDNQGQALFVWAQTSEIHSWTWTGSAWDAAAKTHTAGGTTIYWVRLAADPNSDNILLGYYDGANDVHTIDWDGSNWGTDRLVENDGFELDYGDSYPFDIIFESASGHENHAIVVYSDNDNTPLPQLRYQHTTDISGDWAGEQTPAAFLDTDDCHWIQLVRDLYGTIYMAGQDDGADNLIGKTWDNTSWTNEGVLDTPLSTFDNYKSFAITAPRQVTLGAHSSGQITNQFDDSGSVDDADLFRFQLINPGSSAVTVNQIVFELASVSGVDSADLSDLRINNGTSDVVTAGVPIIDGTTGTITFSADWTIPIPAGSTVDYTLTGDAASLDFFDTMTVSLSLDDINLGSVAKGGTAPSSVQHIANPSVTLDQHSSGQLGDQFDSSSSHDDLSVFRFALTNNTASTVTVDIAAFQLSLVYGISDETSDLSDIHIYEDGNPTPKASTPTVAINEGTGTGTITFSDTSGGLFTIAADTSVDYILVCDVSNLEFANTLTLSLGSTNVTLDSGTVAAISLTDVTHTTNPSSVDIQIGATNDDSHASDSGDNAGSYETASYVYVTAYYDNNMSKYNGGFRFPSISINQGMKIVSATFSGYLYSTSDDMTCTIYGHDTDSAPDFVTNTYIKNQTERPRTSASKTWNTTLSSGWNDVDVTTIVQEIIDRGTWSSGNAIALLFMSTAQSSMKTAQFYSYDGDSTRAAKLTIEYSQAGDITLDDHTLGQVSDQFDDDSSTSDANLFSFQLANGGASAVAIDRITFQLSAITGITDSSSDLTNLQIYSDDDGNGTPDTLKTNGSGYVTIDEGAQTGTIIFSSNSGLFSVPAGQTVDYILEGDAANLVMDDSVTIALTSGDIITDEGTTAGGDPATSVTHTTDPYQIDTAFNSANTIALEWPNQRKLVRDTNGYWYVVYTKMNGSRYEVKMARCTDLMPDGDSTWSKVTLFGDGGVILDDDTKDFKWPSIDVKSSRDELHVIALDDTSSPRILYYSKCTNLSNWNAIAGL
jgi:hypothetical protein